MLRCDTRENFYLPRTVAPVSRETATEPPVYKARHHRRGANCSAPANLCTHHTHYITAQHTSYDCNTPRTPRIHYITQHNTYHYCLQDPFTTSEEDAIWASTTRISGLLKLRHISPPPYYTPLTHYPPDRLYKEFVDVGNRELISSYFDDRDEL